MFIDINDFDLLEAPGIESIEVLLYFLVGNAIMKIVDNENKSDAIRIILGWFVLSNYHPDEIEI